MARAVFTLDDDEEEDGKGEENDYCVDKENDEIMEKDIKEEFTGDVKEDVKETSDSPVLSKEDANEEAIGDQNEDDDEETTDPLVLARKLFADVTGFEKSNKKYLEPFSGGTFEYFSPASFGHELPGSIDRKGTMIPEVCFLGRSNVGGFFCCSLCCRKQE